MSMSMKYRMKKMAKGGMSDDMSPKENDWVDVEKGKKISDGFSEGYAKGGEVCYACGGKMMAEGGFVNEEEASGYHEMPMKKPSHMVGHPVENQSEDGDDMISGIMKSRAKGYSKGGKVANDTFPEVEFAPNEFDDLVLRDDLESSYNGKNSGDELGNAEHESEDRDMVSQIMKSRKKKDRLPSPA